MIVIPATIAMARRYSTARGYRPGAGGPPAATVGRRDLSGPAHRSGLPLGVLGDPRPAGARVALRRPARLAARGDRPDRARQPVRGARLHAAALGARPGSVPRPVRHAVRRDPEGADGGDLAGLPADRGGADRRARLRVAGAARAPAGELQHADAAGRGPRPGRGAARRRGRQRRGAGRPHRRPRRGRGLRARPRRGADGRRLGRRAAGQDREHRRPGALHRPVAPVARDGSSAVAGGWQPLPAYDVLVANLDPASGASRRPTGRDRCCTASRTA